jgi:hypothetical protein
MISFLLTEMNLMEVLWKICPQSLALRLFRKWMSLQDPYFKTRSTGSPNKFWTSLYAKVLATQRRIIILRTPQTLN